MQRLLETLWKGLATDSIKGGNMPEFSKAARASLLSSIDNLDVKKNKLENFELSELVSQLGQTVQAVLTKSNLVDEENVFYRNECAKLMQRLANTKPQ